MSRVQTVPLLTEWRPCSLRSPHPSPLSHSHNHCFMKSMSALPSTCINLTSSQLSTFGDFSLLCYSSGLFPCPPTVYAPDRSQMVLGELQPEHGPAQLRTPHTPCHPTLQGINGPKALQNPASWFLPVRVSSPHWPHYCAPARRHPPTGPVHNWAPPGGFSPIYPWGLFNWRPSLVTLFCVYSRILPPCPSYIFSHLRCPILALGFICSLLQSPLPPSINSTKASIPVSLLPPKALLDAWRKHIWEGVALHPCRKGSKVHILQIWVIAQRMPFQLLMLESGWMWYGDGGRRYKTKSRRTALHRDQKVSLQREITHRWRQWAGCRRIQGHWKCALENLTC